eukprot:TRINITY_DN79702_c0_g1_i1.p1 TRINITY_DN79702_c0_g1~~TRINITY_DN79702_c0_g1_i1.p1  ORF type:complete len:534 (-),score=89.30 TRINITY_DN79702_c0_g1_i1:43-1644(-)
MELSKASAACWFLLSARASAEGTTEERRWPHGPIDPYRWDVDAELQKLFRWHASPDGLLSAEGLQKVLEIQQRADSLPPLPLDFTRSLFEKILPGNTWDETFFLRFYGGYVSHRRRLQLEWSTCCAVEHNPDCCRPEAWEAAAVLGKWLHADFAPRALGNVRPAPPAGGFADMPRLIAEAARPLPTCGSEIVVSCAFQGLTRRHEKERTEATGFQGRLAVLVTGMVPRYYPQTTFKHVVRPATLAGYWVDYHAMLDWLPVTSGYGAASAWSQRTSYSGRATANPAFANASKEALADYISRHAKYHGARDVHLHLMDPGIQDEPRSGSWRRYLGFGTRYSKHLFNSIRRLKNVEVLWNATVVRQHLLTDFRGIRPQDYSHVIWIRDDSHFVADVNLDLFRDPWGIYSTPMRWPCQSEEGYKHISDRVLVMGIRAAEHFLQLSQTYWHHPSEELDNVECIEDFLQVVARHRQLKWHVVRNDWMANFISMHIEDSLGQPQFCLRGLDRRFLEQPQGPCVHPTAVPYRSCEEDVEVG